MKLIAVSKHKVRTKPSEILLITSDGWIVTKEKELEEYICGLLATARAEERGKFTDQIEGIRKVARAEGMGEGFEDGVKEERDRIEKIIKKAEYEWRQVGSVYTVLHDLLTAINQK